MNSQIASRAYDESMTDVRKTTRHTRLRAALRENLKRRKAQAKERASEHAPDLRDGSLDPAAAAAGPDDATAGGVGDNSEKIGKTGSGGGA